MDVIGLAQQAGLAVVLDGRIGREEYRSVSGSLEALNRFAALVAQHAVQDAAASACECTALHNCG
ncbi:TPA: hypothetical protein ACK3Q6_004437 [Burkholderia cepacia]